MIHTLQTAALVSLVVVATATDLRTRRIPNALTLSGLVVGLALRAALGFDALIAGLLGVALALVLTVPLVSLGGLGGGDAKLLAAVGAFLGLGDLPVALLVTALAGGALALALAVRRGAIGETLSHAGGLVTRPFRPAAAPLRTLRTPGALAIPYGVAIAVGALAGWWA